jgi:Hepatocellular carcinoma-associated antigen 59
MFKKRPALTRQKGFRKAKTPNDADDDDSDADEDEAQATSTLQQIEQTKKKRKLLTEAQYKRGVGADELLQQTDDRKMGERADAEEDAGDDGAPSDVADGKNKKSNVATSRDGILEQKHSEAMAKYIEEQMMGEKAKTAAGQAESSTQDDETTSSKQAVLLTKDALYAELAVTSQRLAGKMDNNADQQADNAATTISTDDLGSGGAVLVAGTGIAEVILPVEERLQVARETKRAQQQHQQKRAAARKAAAAASAAGTSAVVAPRPPGLPNRFYIPSRPPQTMTADHGANRGTEEPLVAAASAVDDDRLGFEARQRQKEGPGGGGTGKKPSSSSSSSSAPPLHHRDRANDLRVYRNFVSRERDKKK